MHDTRRTRLVLSVLLIAALALITIDYRDSGWGPLRSLSRLGGTVFGPVERLAGDVTGPAARLASGTSSGAKISALQRQVDQLRAELSQAQLSKYQDTQLKQLLRLAAKGQYRIVPADVIAAAAGYESTVTIDAGSKNGVKPNETVLNGDGLVGRVVSVSSTTSTVLLATDGSSVVGARMAGSGQIGYVTGTGKGLSGPYTLQLKLFNAGVSLRADQQLVTFGSIHGGPYVPGVPIGTIIRVERGSNPLTPMALVRPFVDFTSLGVVGVVVTPPQVNPGYSVLPPPVHPSPTPTVTKTVYRTRPASPGPGATYPGASPSPGRGG